MITAWEWHLARILARQCTMKTLMAAGVLRGQWNSDDRPDVYASDQITVMMPEGFSDRLTELGLNGGATECDCLQKENGECETLKEADIRAIRRAEAFAAGILAEARQLLANVSTDTNATSP